MSAYQKKGCNLKRKRRKTMEKRKSATKTKGFLS